MDSGILGLGAAAWADAWNAAAPEAGLRLSIDPARLLELLQDVPASHALLSDLQRAVPTGRAVELLVTPDRQLAEIATGTSHHVLTVAARDSVLRALVDAARTPAPRAAGRTVPAGAKATVGLEASRRSASTAGVLWRSPGAEAQQPAPLLAVPLAGFGAQARLEVGRDDAGGGASDPCDDGGLFHATLRLDLPHLGTLAARIRVCGGTVAVTIECDDPQRLQPWLAELGRRLVGLAFHDASRAGSAPR
jgi:hypothetical protein